MTIPYALLVLLVAVSVTTIRIYISVEYDLTIQFELYFIHCSSLWLLISMIDTTELQYWNQMTNQCCKQRLNTIFLYVNHHCSMVMAWYVSNGYFWFTVICLIALQHQRHVSQGYFLTQSDSCQKRSHFSSCQTVFVSSCQLQLTPIFPEDQFYPLSVKWMLGFFVVFFRKLEIVVDSNIKFPIMLTEAVDCSLFSCLCERNKLSRLVLLWGL